MNENKKYIRARLKTQDEVAKVYPPAKHWGKPLDRHRQCHGADEVILQYLDRMVLLRKKRLDLTRFYYEIKHTDNWVVMPDWIKYFDSPELVPPADWKDPENEVSDDIWLEQYEERMLIFEGMMLITG